MPTGPPKARPDDRLRMNPEPRDSPMCNCTSEVRANARPGMMAKLFQIDIEFVRMVAADQRQFQRRALRVRARRHAVELKGKTLDPGRAMVEQLWHRQPPVRRRSLDKQVDVLR